MVEQYTQACSVEKLHANLILLDELLLNQEPFVQQVCVDLSLYREDLSQIYPDIVMQTESRKPLQFSVLRLDQLHSFISGNKWPKLRGWLYDVIVGGLPTQPLSSMGGAHSNHLLAFAAAVKELGLSSRCFVRANGLEEQLIPTETTLLLQSLGAELVPVSRSVYREMRQLKNPMFCPEGGRSQSGAKSVARWVQMHAALFSGFQSIYTAVGTGTWIAGLMCGFSQLSLQQLSLQTPIELIGVPAVAGKKWLAQDIISLFEQIHKESDKQRLCESKSIDWKLNWSYPKKGFGPVDPLMLEILAGIFPFPLDPVYLPRVLYVLILEYLKGKREKSMVIHSGGLRPSMMLNKELI